MLLGRLSFAVVVLASTSVLVGCANTYTCADYETCTPPEAGMETGRSDGHLDGRGDAPTKHDGGTDATTDGPTVSESGAADGGKDAVDSPSCDPMGDPSTNPCAITPAEGVFVALGDGGAGAGTPSDPYTSIQAGITNAGTKRVYVCGGTYAESLHVTSGVSVYGGFACANGVWSYASAATTVQPPAQRYALDIESVTGAHFEHLTFAAADAVDAGAPSIAVMVNGSTGIAFVDVTVTAATGAAGAKGADWAESNWCSTSKIAGAASTGTVGADGGICVCSSASGESSQGGRGGASASVVPGGGAGFNGSSIPDAAVTMAGADGRGGNGTGGVSCVGPGGVGANGAATDAGAPGTEGTILATGWEVSSGGVGAYGDPGQGGGGGGGISSHGGAGGGAGGCGGTGGSGGGGGGASIGIAVVNSQISVGDLTITIGGGGAGGAGGAGQQGQQGGAGGSMGASECFGGIGGAGAGGAGGGGGAGGASVGIAFHGTSTVVVNDAGVTDAATLPTGSHYTGTSGGMGGSGGPGGPAADGGGFAGTMGTQGPQGFSNAVRAL